MRTFTKTIGDLEDAMRVSHVASGPLQKCYEGDTVGAVRAWAVPQSFNNVPVCANGRICGVLENLNGDLPTQTRPNAAALMSDSELVGAVMRPLASDMLIEGSQPLNSLVDALLQSPHYRLVLSAGSLDAIVTPADLGKLPMRVLIFTMWAHLEGTMNQAIRSCCTSDEDAIAMLSAEEQANVRGQHQRMRAMNLNPSMVELTSVRAKASILTTAGVFSGSPSTVSSQFDVLQRQLRNPLVHDAGIVDDSLEALTALRANLHAVKARTTEVETSLRTGPRPDRGADRCTGSAAGPPSAKSPTEAP